MKSSNGLYEALIVVQGRTQIEATEVSHNSNVYIEGREGSEYKLRFRNHSGVRVLVVPSVDGLSVVNGKVAALESPGYVVEPFSSIDIPGWMVNSQTAAKFVFARKGGSRSDRKTYAETQGTDPNNIGIIGFAVFEEKVEPKIEPNVIYQPYPVYPGSWPYGPPVFWSGTTAPPLWNQTTMGYAGLAEALGQTSHPGDAASCAATASTETMTRSAPQGQIANMLASSPQIGTGFGQATTFTTHSVEFKRAATASAVLTLIYDTITNLAKMGVPVDQFRPNRPPAVRNAFPASPNACTPPAGWNPNKR